MIKVATVFSGIGAVEHALKRMNIDHKIVFACDNGDVDILSKKITNSIVGFQSEYDFLKNTIVVFEPENEFDLEYKDYLYSQLNNVKTDLDELSKFLSNIELANVIKLFFQLENSTLEEFIGKDKFNKIEFEEYKFRDLSKHRIDVNFYILTNILLLKKKDLNELNIIFQDKIRTILTVINEDQEKFFASIIIDIKDKLSMLHERISTQNILSKLDKMEDYEEKKRFVDDLYKKHEGKNNVRKSYLSNYNLDIKDFHWNVSFLDGKQYANKVDLFVGGSPCQSFSLVGKQRGLDDTRGTLFYEFARLVSEIKPKVFIYENVKAVLSNSNGKTWKTMQRVFNELDYDFSYKVLNAKDYGIPQNRERLFVVGFRKDISSNFRFEFPKPIGLETKMKDYLQDNVSSVYYLNRKGVEFVTSDKNIQKRYTQIDGDIQLCQKKNQQFNWHGDFIFVKDELDREIAIQELKKYYLSEKVEKYVMSTGTKSYYIKPKIDLDVARPLLTTMHKMHRAGVDNYVTTNGRIRKLTPRECLRLMGFCDSFKIVVSDTSMYQQAGNSIVVDVLMCVLNTFVYDLIKQGE